MPVGTRSDSQLPTVMTVPCFSGAPWDPKKPKPLSDLALKTMRLPESVDDVEQYADFVETQVADLCGYILVGDSLGAVVSRAFATRQPSSPRALVLSGGFASNPVRNLFLKARIQAARFFPGPLYRWITLRMHAASLASPFDSEGEVPWSEAKSRQLFTENTPYSNYVARAKAALDVDYLDRLSRIKVPTLIITPEHDTLIGESAANEMLEWNADAHEVVLEPTGHMLR